MHIIEHRQMKSYLKRMLRILLSLEPNEKKVEGPKMRYEPNGELGEKNKVEKEIFLCKLMEGNS